MSVTVTLGSAMPTSFHPYSAVLQGEFLHQKGRYGVALFGHVLEPLADIGVLVLWHYAMRVLPVYGTSIILFISSGIFPMFLFVHMSSQFLTATKLSQYMIRGVKNIHVMTAKGAIAITTFLLTGIILFGVEYFYVSPLALPFSPLRIILSVLSLLGLGIGMATINAVFVIIFPIWRYLWGGVARVSILFAGVLYVPDWLPLNLRGKIQWNPVLQGVALFRQGIYPGYPQLIFKPEYLAFCTLGLLAFGLCLERVTRDAVGTRTAFFQR